MPRKPRIESPGALYHVIARGNHRQDIFIDDSDRDRYISTLKVCKDKYKFSIYAFVLMSNHVHLLIEASDIPLSKIMQSLHTSYTQYFNVKYKKSGHLFQGRYKAILCQKDAYLLQLVRYIHQNPIRAFIVTKLEDYKWSSHQSYIDSTNYPFIETLFVLSMFDSNLNNAKKRYLQFAYESDKDISSKIYQPIFGNDTFIDEIQRNLEARSHTEEKTQLSISLDRIVEAVSKALNTDIKLIASSSRDKASSLARGIISHIAIDYSTIPLKDVATYLHRDPSSVSRICHKIRLANESDAETHKAIDLALKSLSNS